MIMERIFQTELTIQENNCEEKSVYRFQGETCIVSKPLQNISMSSGSLHEDIMLKEETVDDPDEDYEDGNMKSSEALKDVTIDDNVQGEKRKKKEKTYPCEKCQLISQSSANFKKHMMTHSGEKPYKCVICQKAFRQRHHLTDHRRTHTGERPFECDECGSRFVQKSSLNLHKKKHSGIKPYSCNMCNHSTYEKMHMIMHMRTHTGEKPYQCEKCGHMFSNATRLKFHRMIHTGERQFKCDECGVNFREKVTLQKHKGVHINVGPFECEECGQEFSRLAGLSLHRKVHTKKHDYLYVFNKTAHEALKSTPPAEVATSKKTDIESSGIVSNSDRAKNVPNAICNTQHNPNVVQFTGSPTVSCEEQVHIRRITSNMPGTTKSDSNVYTSSTFDSNEPRRNNVVPSRVETFSQNKVKENLASSLSENVQNLDSVVHPDHVRAALVSGTVLETQDEHGKGFFIVLPPSLKNKDITFISDSTHPNGSMISLPLQVTDHTMDLPENETVVENSPETFSEKDNNGNNEAYQSVVQEIHEVDVCNYSVEVPDDDVNCSPREVQELHDDDDDDLHHYQDETHICPEDVQGEMTDDDQRYSQVVREEIHADGGSLLLWNDGLEHLTEVTYVIEEGNEDPIMIHPQETKSHSVETLREVEMRKPKKRKSKGSEFPDDDLINPRRQKRHKSDCERPISVRIKVKDKKLKEKRVKTRKVYDCQQCGKVCKTSSNYISHMRTHSGERPYFCGFCGMGFKQIAHLRSHIRIHTGERPYVCTICNAAFTQSSRLNSHRKTKHAEGRNIVIKKDKPVIEHKVRNFYCKVCKKTFINECFKIDHMRTHISLEPYECKICGIRYKSKSSMIKHNLKHSDHKCICEICGAGFLDLSSLQNHRITQHEMSLTESGMSDMCINVKIGEEKDFVVINPSIKDIQKVVVDSDKVNEEFIDVTEANDCQVKEEVIHVTDTDGYVKSEVMPAADLDDTYVKNEKIEVTETEGYRMEVGESPWSDNVSSIKGKNEIEQSTDFNDTFHRNSDICLGSGTEFQLSDTAEPIKDEFSEKNYATYVDSIGRKIWVCKVCDKPFLQSSNLHSHMRMHTGERPYKCNICPQAFRQITHLKDHMSRHTGMKPYKCGECGSCFSQRSAVTRHIKNLHNENAKVIKNTEYIMNGGRNMPHLDFENEPSGSKQPLQVEKIVSRRPRKRKPKENVNQNSLAEMKTCDISDKLYMKPHQQCHTGERPYKCSLCEEAFMQKAHLHSHELHHTEEKPYVCKKCGASYIQSFMLNIHMRKCMEDKEGINTCSVKKHLCVCGTSFRLIRQLLRHQKSCMVMEDSDDKSIDMTELDAQLDEESEDEYQFRRKKKNQAHKKRKSKRNRTPETTEFSPASSVKIFTCKVCNVTLKNFAEYKTHLQQHGGGTQQVCEDCGAPFRRASALRFHQRVKHDRIDDRYKDYTSNFVGQEDIKEEFLDGSGDDDNAQVQPNHINMESDSYSENIAKKIEENVEESNGRHTKEDVKVNKTHKIAKLKSHRSPTKGNAVKRSITHTKEYAGRVSNKPVRGSTRLKNRKNKRSVIVPGSVKTGKASSIKVDKLVNKSRKVPDGEYDTQYACEACGKVFTRSSKLKHHVAMWCKGLQDHSEVDISKDIEVQQQPSQVVKRTKRKCSKFSRKDNNDSSPVHFSSKETKKNFRSSNITSYQSEHLTGKDIISKDSESKVLSTLDIIKSDEQEAKQRTVNDKNLSNSQYCKDCDIHSCKVHLQTYVAKQSFRCNQCCLTFSQKAHLTNHSRKHKSEKPYKCRAFSKAVTRASRSKDHTRIHGKNICTFEI